MRPSPPIAAPPGGFTGPVKRSITIAGHQTSISLEPLFWQALESAAAARTPVLADGCLTAGGPQAAFPQRIEKFLRKLALERLSDETARISDRAAVRPTSVTVGDAATRWGSCSSAGRIRYSWRLILAPPEARLFVVAHEVAHLEHLLADILCDVLDVLHRLADS